MLTETFSQVMSNFSTRSQTLIQVIHAASSWSRKLGAGSRAIPNHP